MKLNTNSSLKLISFFPLLLLFVLSSYFAYTAYFQYKDTQNFQNRLSSNKILKNLSVNLAKERGLSATYFGSQGKIAKKALQAQRVQTDRTIREFNNYFKNKPVDIQLTQIIKYLAQITNIRNSLDKFDISFNKMFFGYYSKVNALLFDEYKKILNIQITPEISSEESLEADLFQEMEKSGQERGFVSYVISKDRPFSNDEYSTWLKIFTKVDLSNFSINILDNKLKNSIRALLHNKKAMQLYNDLINVKIAIIQGSNAGSYQVKPVEWFQLMTKKISLLNRTDALISSTVSIKTKDWFKNEVMPKLIVAIGVLLLVIFLMILGYFIEGYIKRSIKELGKLFSKVGQLADIDEEIDFQTTDGIDKGYRIIEIAIDQIQQDKQIALEASKAKSIFLANMSHEIRTPLNGIIGFTELLKNTDISGEEREFVDIIEKSSENLLEIINNILDLSKIESDKIEIEEILFSPITEFENAVEVFGAKAAEKDIRLSFYMDPSLNNYLSGDPTKIKEVLINLVSNAIKFTSVDGEIDVEIRRVAKVDSSGRTKVQFSVKDNGIGISEEKLKTIFDAFSQADSTITRKYGGTGLGLTISSKFVALMGGKLEVESKEGEGTRFFFTLEFDESPSSEFNFKDGFMEFKCALLANEKDRKLHTQYIYDYLKYFGCDTIFFYHCKEINGLIFREDINFIIADIDFIEENDIDICKNINLPGILILKSSMQAQAGKYVNENIKPIYEPVNVTKLANTLEKQRKLLPKISSLRDNLKNLEESNEESSKNDEQAKANDDRIQVLAVEDNDINRKLIKRTLENYNINVTLATNGQEGLDKAKNSKFDIIFMDIAMPVMDGVKALHAILDDELEQGKKHTPIVALTANALKGDRERFLNEGFDEYITKPIKSSSLESILNMFLSDKFNKNKKDEKQKESSEEEEVKPYEIKSSTKEDKSEKISQEIEDNSYQQEQENEDENVYEESYQEEDFALWKDEEKQSENIIAFEEDNEKQESEKFEEIDDIVTAQEIPVDKNEQLFEQEKNKEQNQKDENIAPVSSNGKIEVLTVEDNAINQKLIERTLLKLGLNVSIANNGQEALDMFKENRYDIIFMDISMPVMDGIEATHEILAYEKEHNLPHTPIVALTANALPGDREAFLSEGLDDYISKPLKTEDIVKVLKIFLNYTSSTDTDSIDKKEIKQDTFDNFENESNIDKKELTKELNNESFEDNMEQKDVLIYKNNQIEAKILSNMMSRMGYSVDIVLNFDEFLIKMQNCLYKIILFDKNIEFVDKSDIIDKVKAVDKQRDKKTIIVEFVDKQDSNKEEDLSDIDEIMDNIINKKRVREILEKYLR